MCLSVCIYVHHIQAWCLQSLLESIQKPDLANMCMVQKPEERYKVVLQVNVKELSKLSQEQTLEAPRASKESLVIQMLSEIQLPYAGGGGAGGRKLLPRPSADGQWHSDRHHLRAYHGTEQAAPTHPPYPSMDILKPYVLSAPHPRQS